MSTNKTSRSTALRNLKPGTEIRLPPRHMTRERMRWYVDTQPTVAADDGRIHRGGPTIHDDDAFALSQGLPGIIADGMISTNWIAGLMFDLFGADYLKGGRLQTKYIAPIFENEHVTTCARLTSLQQVDKTTRYEFEVWCEGRESKPLTVGHATVTLDND